MSKRKYLSVLIGMLTTCLPAFGGWQILYQDTFNSFDYGKWSKSFPWGKLFANHPNTYYPHGNVWISNGELVLKATANNTEANGIVYNWQGAAVNSHQKMFRGPGTRLRARIKAPFRNGINSAFWMIASDRVWPPEIDIFEFPGAQSDNGKKVRMALHYGTNSNPQQRKKTWTASSALTGSYHNYEIRWFSGSKAVEWWINGVKRASEYNNTYTPNENMYAVISVSVNNDPNWHGTPANSGWNSYMYVKWFEWYKQT